MHIFDDVERRVEDEGGEGTLGGAEGGEAGAGAAGGAEVVGEEGGVVG